MSLTVEREPRLTGSVAMLVEYRLDNDPDIGDL